jgi:DNA-binding MarR family transcriptional regulator/GNAT superfamily N-acetyltransferase
MVGCMTIDAARQAVSEIRAFNRFYTNVIGLLRGGHLDTPYSLTEARVLFELAHTGPAEVAALRRTLDIDAGYLSRLLARFDGEGLAVRERSASDGRRQVIRLTEAGRAAFAELDARQSEQTAGLLAGVDEAGRERLLAAMRVIREVLPEAGGDGERPARPRAYLLRPPRPGDLGWVVYRHGALYAAEYGFDERFEHLVARIVADYAESHDPEREAAWIAEVDGQPAGCVLCVRKDDETAQLRVLLVEPFARRLGIGSRLVQECVRFARRAGYRQIMLWTLDALTDAARLYERAGFRLVEEGKPVSFGPDLVEQIWSLPL